MARATRARTSGRSNVLRRRGPPPPGVFDSDASDDRISRYLQGKDLVPKELAGSDRFLDVVSWNIRYFDHQDPVRVKHVTEVLNALNADAFVLVEIAADGALDEVVERLAGQRAGYYSIALGRSGSQQRVALLWDRDWIRSKKDPIELFAGENLTVLENEAKKDVFPRLPLWGLFDATAAESSGQGFTFELVGVHLKAQGGGPVRASGAGGRAGIPQRTAAAERLARWLETPAEHNDTDVIIVGDWNASTGEVEWEPIRKLEEERKVAFSAINDPGKPTHLVRLNKTGPAGSRLDMHLLSENAVRGGVPDNVALVINWKPFEDLETLAGGERLELLRRIKERFSDHLPVVSRFYLAPP
jgi:endonuclease/exonuclease/phosphatase family metal-dependent hydrolase